MSLAEPTRESDLKAQMVCVLWCHQWLCRESTQALCASGAKFHVWGRFRDSSKFCVFTVHVFAMPVQERAGAVFFIASVRCIGAGRDLEGDYTQFHIERAETEPIDVRRAGGGGLPSVPRSKCCSFCMNTT